MFNWHQRRGLKLALQGGGAHGAFTWGVLDYLLAHAPLVIEGISGTSAGAMNAVVLAEGWRCGGAAGARAALDAFWTAVAQSLPFDAAVRSADGAGFALSPAMRMMVHWSHYLSPSQMNPLNLNPLRDIVEAQVDFAALRRDCPMKLLIAATQASTGRLRLFREPELTADMLLASACLPTVHHGVEIDGEPYWDGGYAANPPILPLIGECATHDLLLVMLAPLQFADTPHRADEIRSRVSDIAFNAPLLREMAQLGYAQQALGRVWCPTGRAARRLAKARVHLIHTESSLADHAHDSKLAVSLPFFETLKAQGRASAQAWWAAHETALGKRGTVDVNRLFGSEVIDWVAP